MTPHLLTLPPTRPDQSTDPVADGNADKQAARLESAFGKLRGELLSERNDQGFWEGRLCDSPLSTATAISALVIAEQQSGSLAADPNESAVIESLSVAYRSDLSETLIESLQWLADRQNEDGGWGDTDRSGSNIATTMLVLAAFRLTCVPAKCVDLEPRAEEYLRKQGGVAGLRKRYGRDKTFAVPILANCALAGVVSWRQVPSLPFELAAMPQKWFKRLRLPVVSYALPALVAIGLVKFVKRPPLNPITRWVRRAAVDRCLALVERMQPDSGGFLEATPLTSFVVMALAGAGYAEHPVVRRGVEFLLASIREGGAWPIDTNLACWNTTLALNALGEGGRGEAGEGVAEQNAPSPPPSRPVPPSIDWLLNCQHTERHPFTDAEPGGWAWTDLSGGVPDADDTPGALLVLARVWRSGSEDRRDDIAQAARLAVDWLLNLQNTDGGWPTFCRGWGKLPFDRSATDLTAHAMRALAAWRDLDGWQDEPATRNLAKRNPPTGDPPTRVRISDAIARGLRFLARQQSADGFWNPLWFGNEHRPDEANPVYGTARVLLALQDRQVAAAAPVDPTMALRGVAWLLEQQHADGAWGSAPQAAETPVATVEETSVALEALLSVPHRSPAIIKRAEAATNWLVTAVERDEHRRASPIGLYFAKLWYYERHYPLVFATSALRAALQSSRRAEHDATPTTV